MGHTLAAAALLWLLLLAPPPAAAADNDEMAEGYDLYLRGAFADAAAIFGRAAERGGAEAQYMLGGLYAVGQGVPQDAARARAWLTRAAEGGDAFARWVLSAIADFAPPPDAAPPDAAPVAATPRPPGPAPAAMPQGPIPAMAPTPAGESRPPPPTGPAGRPHIGGVAVELAARPPGPAPPDAPPAASPAEPPPTQATPARLRVAAPDGPASALDDGRGGKALAIAGDDEALDSLLPAAHIVIRGEAPAADGRPAAAVAARDEVARIQRRLAAIGYDPGPADGAAGARTRIAIRAFQRDTGLAIDGRPSPALDAALAAAAGPGGLIATIQRRLNRLGFDAGPVDGVMRPATRGALVDYYRSEGIAGVLDLEALARRLGGRTGDGGEG